MTILRPEAPELSLDDLSQWQSLRCRGFLKTRMMGALGDVLDLIAEEDLVAPAIAFKLWPAYGSAGGVIHVAGDKTLRIPPLAQGDSRVATLAIGVCTIGAKLEKRVRELYREGRHLRSILLDEAGNAALYALSDVFQRQIRSEARSRGLEVSSAVNPGDVGFPIEDQPILFKLADAASIGVRLTESGMLSPEKSLSAVVGLGASMPRWSRAERCARCASREKCRHSLFRDGAAA